MVNETFAGIGREEKSINDLGFALSPPAAGVL